MNGKDKNNFEAKLHQYSSSQHFVSRGTLNNRKKLAAHLYIENFEKTRTNQFTNCT